MALQLKPGDKYENFEVLAVTRKYDASWVYRCKAPGHDKPVGVRISLDPVKDEAAARRALRELEVLGELTNAHVIKMFDSGMGADERWYMVLENLEGAQLDYWHDFDRPMPPAQAVGLIHQACLGLAEVHARGVVHRNLKPANLWVEPSGNLKIVDFASARGFGANAVAGDNVTTQHVLVGTPQYAPPEQVYSSTLTAASDVYSLGVILYELLSGRCPFWAENPRSEIVRRLADDPVDWMNAHVKKPVVSLRGQVPENLAELLDTCLAKKPIRSAGCCTTSSGRFRSRRCGSWIRAAAWPTEWCRPALIGSALARASTSAYGSTATTKRGHCSSGRVRRTRRSCECSTRRGR
jgi:serine/threonine protein kinase